ncbi:MAG: hypothetical protein RLZZ385_885 [Pseudomonadota bacterium]|jgi:8-oxo-dGTP diphosphatase
MATAKPPVHVAVGVVLDAQDQVLIALRPLHQHQGGLWEFPGGKVESGETVVEALDREFREELDVRIDPRHCHPLQKILHHYLDKSVLLDVWTVSEISGRPRGLQGQEVRWQSVAELQPANFPAANRAIIRTLQLPRRIAITPPDLELSQLLSRLPILRSRGVGLLQLRLPEVSANSLQKIVGELIRHCQKQGLQLMVNGTVQQIAQHSGIGLHLNSQRLMAVTSRPVPTDVLFSASCHNEQELQQALNAGVDFVLLSPVQTSKSHPGVPGMGWDRFQTLADKVSIPVFALGGLREADLVRARSAGAHGIAAISAFWDI